MRRTELIACLTLTLIDQFPKMMWVWRGPPPTPRDQPLSATLMERQGEGRGPINARQAQAQAQPE